MHDVLHEVCKYDLCLVNSRAALFGVKYFCCLSRRDVSVFVSMSLVTNNG